MLTKSSVLHYWSSRYGINPRVGGRPVYTRNSAGVFVSQEGEVDTAVINTPRFDWATLNLPNSQSERRKLLTLEMARTNGWTFAEDLTNAVWTKTRSTITANTTLAPDGLLTADKLVEDSSVTTDHYVSRAFPTLSDNTFQPLTVFAKAGERTWIRIRTTNKANVTEFSFINLSTGAIGTNTAGHTQRITPLGGGWYRIEIVFASSAGATTPIMELALASADNTVAYTGNGASGAYIWGFDFETDKLFATAYKSTTTSTTTRATDSLYWNFAPVPQAMMLYCRFIESGNAAAGAASQRLWSIGNATDSDEMLTIFMTATGYRLHHGASGSSVTSTLATSPAIGDTVELLAIAFADGSVQVVQSINGAPVTSPGASGARAFTAAWSDKKLWLNGASSSVIGAAKFADKKIVQFADVVGITDQARMDEMRAFELGPNGDVL